MSSSGGIRNWRRHWTAGLEFTIIFLGFLGIGLYLDRLDEVTPAYTVIGAVIGFIVGIRRLLQHAREIRDENEKSDDQPDSS